MEPIPPGKTPEENPQELQSRLRRLESRHWWLTWTSVGVMLLLTGAVVILVLPTMLEEGAEYFQLRLDLTQALRGLVGLVLLFNIYALWQQFLISRLRTRLVEQIEKTVRVEAQAGEWQQLALLDPLTGLFNRRLAEDQLETEMARANRHGRDLSLMMLDLNGFKQINDRYTHVAGDLVLKQFAERLKKSVRFCDVPVRIGGDEFMVILPECRPEHIQYVLVRLAGLEVEFRGDKIPVTFAAGWAGYQPGEEAELLLERADKALYKDKQSRGVEQQVREMQRMEAVGRLAGGVAHDFNSLLMLIKGYSELLSDQLPPEGSLRNYCNEIEKAAERATTITRQLLTFSRRQVLEAKVLESNAILRDMEEMLHRLVGERVALVMKLSPQPIWLKADRSQLEQVVMNLAVNARDAMPTGGQLTIETQSVELDPAFATRHPGAHPGSYVMLAVTDSGMGMNEETKAHMFEPFFTTKEAGRGTGLGLSIVYGVVKQYGGYISVVSEPGRGSTFRIYLPRAEQATETPKPLAPCEEGRTIGTVLLVEDEESVRKLVRQFLESISYEVLEAREATEAITLAERYGGQIRLLVTDLIMPGTNGHDLAQRLRQLCPVVKVLYVSGYDGGVVNRHEELEPGVAFLQKPFSRDALARKVSEIFKPSDVG